MLDTSECIENKCPIQFTLDLIGSKWSLLILRELFAGQRRTHEFLEVLPGISSKTLTARLRELEAHGLVARQVYPEIPPVSSIPLPRKGANFSPS